MQVKNTDPDRLLSDAPDFFKREYKNAAKLLKLDTSKLPDLVMANLIYDSPTIGTCGVADCFVPGVPADEYAAGIYIDARDTIAIAKLAPAGEGLARKFTDKELIFTMLHEIRHVWQRTFHAGEYYDTKNAIGAISHILDPSEVDADAFALWYFFVVLNFENEDLPMDVMYMYSIDEGLRKQRMNAIAEEYAELI